MFKDFNNLCGSCVTMFLYAAIATVGYKTGLYAWGKIENKLNK